MTTDEQTRVREIRSAARYSTTYDVLWLCDLAMADFAAGKYQTVQEVIDELPQPAPASSGMKYEGPSNITEYTLSCDWVRWDAIDEQCWWWWWNEDEDSAPVPVSILYSATNGNYFASMGQLGWTHPQDVKDMKGWWMKMIAPAPPDPDPVDRPADDAEPVDEEWLRSVGFAGDKMGCPTLGPLHIHESGKYACIRSLPIPVPKTRRDVRLLCRALGMTLTE